jgi:hypothetical protein
MEDPGSTVVIWLDGAAEKLPWPTGQPTGQPTADTTGPATGIVRGEEGGWRTASGGTASRLDRRPVAAEGGRSWAAEGAVNGGPSAMGRRRRRRRGMGRKGRQADRWAARWESGFLILRRGFSCARACEPRDERRERWAGHAGGDKREVEVTREEGRRLTTEAPRAQRRVKRAYHGDAEITKKRRGETHRSEWGCAGGGGRRRRTGVGLPAEVLPESRQAGWCQNRRERRRRARYCRPLPLGEGRGEGCGRSPH